MSKVLPDLMLEEIFEDLQSELASLIEKAISVNSQLNEELTPLMGSIVDMIEEAEFRLAAARKGLGLANRLRTAEERKRNRSRVLANMNRLRVTLARLVKSLENANEVDHDEGLGREIVNRSRVSEF